MANNPYVNKVELADGTTVMDISDTTAVASDVASGKYFYNAAGARTLGSASGGGGTNIVYVTGTTPSITASSDTVYICDEVSTLNFTPCATGICDVLFKSGTTATVLTLPTGNDAISWPDWFDPSSLDASTIYELNVLNGKYGVVTTWA